MITVHTGQHEARMHTSTTCDHVLIIVACLHKHQNTEIKLHCAALNEPKPDRELKHRFLRGSDGVRSSANTVNMLLADESFNLHASMRKTRHPHMLLGKTKMEIVNPAQGGAAMPRGGHGP